MLRKILREDILIRVEQQLDSSGINLREMSVRDKIELLKNEKDIWISPDKAYEYEIAIRCPICLQNLKLASCPQDPLGRKYARHEKGGGTPRCREMIKGRIRDLSLGVDDLFGPDPKRKRKDNGPNLIPVKVKNLKDITEMEDVYYHQDPFAVIIINAKKIPMHHFLMLEGSNEEKIRALFGFPSKADTTLGIPETNGQFIIEVRNREEQPYYDENTVVFYTERIINGRIYRVVVDVHFRDEIEFDESGMPMDRLQDKVLNVCAIPEQHDADNQITKIFPNRTPVLLKGILRQKKRLHYERVDLLVFDMDVYSDWDIYACPDDIY